jgi:hypothetical protein
MRPGARCQPERIGEARRYRRGASCAEAAAAVSFRSLAISYEDHGEERNPIAITGVYTSGQEFDEERVPEGE